MKIGRAAHKLILSLPLGLAVAAGSGSGIASAPAVLTDFPRATPPVQRTASERDSIAAQQAAVTALRQLLYQFTYLVRGPDSSDNQPGGVGIPDIEGSCEIRVVDFCYGALNGKISYGGFGTTKASGVYTPSRYARFWRRRVEFYPVRYLTELRRVHKIVPGDRWINGEIVRMDIERGFLGHAENDLKSCRDTAWWCDALKAYVMYRTGSWQESDSLWSTVLSRMTSAERCQWLDPKMVTAEKKLRDSIADLECDAVTRYSERFWWLSDPLHTRPWNERRATHLSRTVAILLDANTQRRVFLTPAMVRERTVKAASLAPIQPDETRMACGSLGNASNESAIPDMYGYPDLVTRAGIPVFCVQNIAQFPLQRHSFVPNNEAAQDHLRSLSTDWNLHDPQAFEFIAGWTRTIRSLSNQSAWFRRSDSARLVIVSALPSRPDSAGLPAEDNSNISLRGQLWLQPDFDQAGTSQTGAGRGRIVFDVLRAPSATFASVELELPRGVTGRVRFGTGPQQMPAQRVSLSDILLFTADDSLPATLEEAAARALPHTRLEQNSLVGLFWEIYGLAPGERASVSLLVTPQRGRHPVRIDRDSLTSDRRNILLTEWEEQPAGALAVGARAVNLNLTTLEPGTYTLSIGVRLAGQQTINSARTIEIVRSR